MNREKVKRVEAQIAPSSIVCFWIEGDMGQTDHNIYCDRTSAKIHPSECPACQGSECQHSSKFIKIVIEDVEPISNEVME